MFVMDLRELSHIYVIQVPIYISCKIIAKIIPIYGQNDIILLLNYIMNKNKKPFIFRVCCYQGLFSQN